MASYTQAAKPKPIKIEQFKGINEAVGKTEVGAGEWISGFNGRITKDYKLQKRPGHHTFIDFESTEDVMGEWYGKIADKEIMLVCWNGSVYEYDMSVTTDTTLVSELITEGTVTIIGSITDAPTTIFWFVGKVYFRNGTDDKEYDGTTYQDTVPYVPTVALNAPPTGGGTLFEEVNLKTGEKTQTFVGDGTTLYQLAESGLDADLLEITVDGVTMVETTDFTVNRTLGQVTFVVAPVNLATVSITWTKVVSGNSDLVDNHKYAILYGKNSNNIFIFGNPNEKNVFRFSGIDKAGYWPANSFNAVTSDQYAITDLVAQYQYLNVYKEDSAAIIIPTVNDNFADNTGLNPYNYGYEGLNNSIGNLAPTQVRLVDDSPVSLDGSSIRLWGSTRSVSGEINPTIISTRIQISLQDLDLANAITFNYEKYKELWVNVDDIVYIWNYGNDTMYKYSNIEATGFIDINGEMYYGSKGTVEHVSSDYLADGGPLGDSILMKLYGGFLDFDALQYRKMMRDEWLAIKPESRTSVKIKFVTDRVNEETAKWYEVGYQLTSFDNVDFDNWSFLTNKSAQVNRIKGKVKKFAYIQWIMENDSNSENLTVLKLLMQCQTQGYSR